MHNAPLNTVKKAEDLIETNSEVLESPIMQLQALGKVHEKWSYKRPAEKNYIFDC